MIARLKRTLLWVCLSSMAVPVCFGALVVWPQPLFAFSYTRGRLVVSSDRPIPAAGAESVLRDCDRLLERSPLKAEGRRYHLYVTNEEWRRRLFFVGRTEALGLTYYSGPGGNSFLSGADFNADRVIHEGYVARPPRTLAYFCAHELTHVVTGEHIGMIALLALPVWVREGIADYVGIEKRDSFEQLRDAIGDRPVDVPMMQAHGSYPRYRLLVTYFLEKKRWSVDRLLGTRLNADEAFGLMRADGEASPSSPRTQQ